MPNPTQMLIPQISTRPLRVLAHHKGGFGHVLIVQADDGVRSALKTLRADLAIDWSALAAEAKTLASLPLHANVISIVGFTWHEGQPFIILPAMNGNLRTLVGQDPLAPDGVAAVLGQVASGLAHLHEHGVLHLDLKPENILVAKDNRYMISDFGLSAFLPTAQDLRTLPEHVASSLMGTLPYMSPEHFATGRLTPKTDIFSLGVILFELLTGRQPFEPGARSSMTTVKLSPQELVALPIMAWRVMNEVPSFTDSEAARIPSSLQAVCLACLEKNALNRPSAAEITAMLGYEQEYVPEDGTIIGSKVDRANSLCELGRVEEAERLIHECLAKNPYYLPAVITAAEIAYGKGDAKSAAAMTERALSIGTWKSPPPPGLGTLLVNASCYYLSIDPEQAIRYSCLALERDPEDWGALGNVAEACRILAERTSRAHKKQELLDQGLTYVGEALKRAPSDLNLLITKGGILVARGDLQILRSFLTETTWPPSAVAPSGGVDPNLGYLLICIYIALGEFKEAEEFLTVMRTHAELQPLVEMAERKMAERKRELGIT